MTTIEPSGCVIGEEEGAFTARLASSRVIRWLDNSARIAITKKEAHAVHLKKRRIEDVEIVEIFHPFSPMVFRSLFILRGEPVAGWISNTNIINNLITVPNMYGDNRLLQSRDLKLALCQY